MSSIISFTETICFFQYPQSSNSGVLLSIRAEVLKLCNLSPPLLYSLPFAVSNFSQCDSLLMGDKCGAHTFPYIEIKDKSAVVEHEATTSKIGEDQLFYCKQRGIDNEKAIGLIVNGYCKEVLNKLPMEFAVEAQKLLAISLEGSVG